jgi:hypothetical protein
VQPGAVRWRPVAAATATGWGLPPTAERPAATARSSASVLCPLFSRFSCSARQSANHAFGGPKSRSVHFGGSCLLEMFQGHALMRYREFGVSTIESDRNRILEQQSSHGLSDVFGVSSPACQGKAQYEYSLVWLEARRTRRCRGYRVGMCRCVGSYVCAYSCRDHRFAPLAASGGSPSSMHPRPVVSDQP